MIRAVSKYLPLAVLLLATHALAGLVPIPKSCKPMELPIQTRTQAVCAVIAQNGRGDLPGNVYSVQEWPSTWRVSVLPDPTNRTGGIYDANVDRETGTVNNLRRDP